MPVALGHWNLRHLFAKVLSIEKGTFVVGKKILTLRIENTNSSRINNNHFY